MKRLLQTIITLILLLSPMCMAASSSAYALWVSKVATIDSLDDKKESPRRQRIPTQPIECVITSNGICVYDSSVNLAEAISYEVWDAESEWCVASFSEEFSFIDSLFAMSGEFQIHIVLPDYELVGNVCL